MARKKAKRSVKKAHGRARVAVKPRTRSPFTSAVLKKMRELLLMYKERIGGNFKNLRQNHLGSSQRDATGDLSGYTLHMADLATDTYDREFALTVASSEGDIIYLIDQALDRIEDKTYGLCETCGSSIKLTRLKAVPWAKLCLKCKKAEETGGEGE